MKFDTQKSFGYPVLRPYSSDYVRADFQSGISLSLDESDPNRYHLSYDVAIGVKEIQELIKQGRAALQLEINCRETFFGVVHELKDRKGSFAIAANQVRGALNVSCYVIAKKRIVGFKSPKINPEYGGDPISFPKYAVLACEAPLQYWVDREFFKNITSIFDYTADPDMKDGLWRLNLDSERVEVICSPHQLQLITQSMSTKGNQAIFVNSIIFAAVVEMINTLKVKSDFQDRRWARNVLAKCASLNIELTEATNAIEAAQTLMSKPLTRLNSHFFEEGSEQ